MVATLRENFALIIIAVFAIIGVLLLVLISAASGNVSVDINDDPLAVNDPNAAGGKAIEFRSLNTSGTPQNYDEALALITNSTFRNKTMDDSPYINTPSAGLENLNHFYGPPSDYFNHIGSYGTVPWYPKGFFPGSGAQASFRIDCEVSHFAYDDPIVFPGQPQVAHLHMFWGNTHINAYSDYDSVIDSGSSTCNGFELNRTGYWTPAMFDGKGSVMVPSHTKFYYKTEKKAGVGKTEVYPENMQLLGDNTNNKEVNGLSAFRCNDIWNSGKSKFLNTIPTCQSPSPVSGHPGTLEYMIFYDYCWNGKDPSDWKKNRDENLVPPEDFWHSSRCPESHPKLLPALVTHIFFDIPLGEDTSTWFIASDVDATSRTLTKARGSTAHSDWFGGWNKAINKEWIDNCNNYDPNQIVECGHGILGDPRLQPNVKALKLREDWIAGPHRIPLSEIYSQMCSVSNDTPYNPANGGAMAAYCQPENAVSHR